MGDIKSAKRNPNKPLSPLILSIPNSIYFTALKKQYSEKFDERNLHVEI